MTLATTTARRPPGPDAPVRLGVDPDTLEVLEAARRAYGEVVAFRTPGGRFACFVNDPDEVRRLLVRRHANYRKGPGFERVKMLLGNGLIVSDGAEWRRARTMIQPAFSRRNLHRLIGLMVECTLARERHWRAVAAAGGILNITQETSEFALEVILRAIFGPDYERRIVRDGENPFAFLSSDPARDLRVVLKMRALRSLLLEIIAGRRAEAEPDEYDFLAAYLAARDRAGNAFTDTELVDEIVNLIVAGYETSAGTLNWAWYLLAAHPDVRQHVATEGRALAGNPDDIDENSAAAMTYTQAVLDETLRLYPPVWLFTRRANEEDTLAAFDVPAGADLYLSPYVLHRTETYWPEPEVFDPDRFTSDGSVAKGERPYFPFSLGPRRCLGEYFAFLEMKIHLGILAPRFVLSRADARTPALQLGINLRAGSDILLAPETAGGSR